VNGIPSWINQAAGSNKAAGINKADRIENGTD
jgi:hypothetical protein